MPNQTKPSQDPRRDPKGAVHRHFATLFARNDSAIHLLLLVQACSPPDVFSSEHLSSTDRQIGYLVVLRAQSGVLDGLWPGRWTIGAGLNRQMPGGMRVDFLLCPPGRNPSSSIARKSINTLHALLSFHPESGAIVLRSTCDKPITFVNGGVGSDLTVVKEDPGADQPDSSQRTRSCVLYMGSNRLQFGQYDFTLDFVLQPDEEEEFKRERDIVVMRNHGVCPSRHLDAVPHLEHRVCWNVCLHRELSHKAPRSIHSGVRLHTGEAVAVKALRSTREAPDRAKNELWKAAQFGRDHEGVLGMFDSWCEHGESPPCTFVKTFESPDDEEEVFYSMPLAEHSFDSMPWDTIELEERLRYFRQTLLGLTAVHDKSMIHGAISPRTLMLLLAAKPQSQGMSE